MRKGKGSFEAKAPVEPEQKDDGMYSAAQLPYCAVFFSAFPRSADIYMAVFAHKGICV